MVKEILNLNVKFAMRKLKTVLMSVNNVTMLHMKNVLVFYMNLMKEFPLIP